MKKYLVIYNICEIRCQNADWYETCLDNILKVDYSKFHVLVSGCRVSKETKDRLYNKYKGKISFCYTDHYLPVNITFNLSVEDAVKKYGEFDGYVYIDSGVDIEDNVDFLKQIDDRFATGKFGMVTYQTDTDNGHHWFKQDYAQNPYIEDEDFIMPVGRCCNLHVTCFSNELLKAYKRLVPDIFLAYCTESVFSFLNAALKLDWVIIKGVILKHLKSTDGASLCVDHTGPKGVHWDNNYGGLCMKEVLSDPRAQQYGFGYEEIGGVMMHNPACYDCNGHCTNDVLKEFIRDRLFLQPDRLDYNYILREFITV